MNNSRNVSLTPVAMDSVACIILCTGGKRIIKELTFNGTLIVDLESLKQWLNNLANCIWYKTFILGSVMVVKYIS